MGITNFALQSITRNLTNSLNIILLCLRKDQAMAAALLIPISGMRGRCSTAISSLLLVAALRGRRVGGGALVRHLRVVTVLPVGGVADDLDTAVGQGHTVLATHNVSVAGCLVRVLVGGLGVIHGVVEVEGHAWLVDVLNRERKGGREN